MSDHNPSSQTSKEPGKTPQEEAETTTNPQVDDGHKGSTTSLEEGVVKTDNVKATKNSQEDVSLSPAKNVSFVRLVLKDPESDNPEEPENDMSPFHNEISTGESKSKFVDQLPSVRLIRSKETSNVGNPIEPEELPKEENYDVSPTVPEETAVTSPTVPEETAVTSPTVPEETAVTSPTVPEETAGTSPTVPEETAVTSPTVPEETAVTSPTVPEETAVTSPTVPEETAGTSAVLPEETVPEQSASEQNLYSTDQQVQHSETILIPEYNAVLLQAAPVVWTPENRETVLHAEEKAATAQPKQEHLSPTAGASHSTEKHHKQTLKDIVKKVFRKSKSHEKIPLLSTEYDSEPHSDIYESPKGTTGQNQHHLEMTSRSIPDMERHPSDSEQNKSFCLNCSTYSYEMASEFTNRSFRDNFIAEIFKYKIYQMSFVCFMSLLVHLIFYTRENNSTYVMSTKVALILVLLKVNIYIFIIALIRYCHVGRTKMASRIIFCGLTFLLCFFSSGMMFVLGNDHSIIISILTATVVMFYTLIYLLVKDKVKYGTLFCFKRIDVDFDIMNSNRMYLRIIPLIILSFIISLVTILTGAKILDLIFTKVQNVVPHIDSDQAPLNVLISYGLTFAILEIEIYRLRSLIAGTQVSLNRNEELFASFFV